MTSGCHTSHWSAVGVAAALPQPLTQKRQATSVCAKRDMLEPTVKLT